MAGPDDEPRDEAGRWTAGAHAVRVGGKVYTGIVHADALEKAAKAHGYESASEAADKSELFSSLDEKDIGRIDDRGRFENNLPWWDVNKEPKQMKDAFASDQPRAENGEWTSGSGADGPPPGGKFERGDHVVHPSYGHGRVEQVSKSGGTVSVRYPGDMVVPHSSDDAAFAGRDPDYSPPAAEDATGRPMNPASRLFREHTPEPLSASTGVQRKRKKGWDQPVIILNKDGAPMPIIFNDATGLLDASPRRTSDGYLVAGAKVARVGVQKYKGHEVGRPQMDSVVLYRPAEEVFHRDALASMANKPVTLTHPRRMVDARSWAKVAKGISGTDVVRDGDFVRVPLMLTDAATIDAFEKDGIKELSVGYMADIDWTPGKTPSGEHYDGVQRAIRANHHALVPVARGGKSLTFGDNGICPKCGGDMEDGECEDCGWEAGDDIGDAAPMKCSDCGTFMKDGKCPDCGGTYDAAFTAEERKNLAEKGQAKPDGSYPIRNASDLKNAVSAWGRGGATASDKAWIIKRARALGATSELPENWGAKDAAHNEGDEDMTTVQVLVDGVPIQVADQAQATHVLRHLKALKDAADDGATDPDAAAKEQEREKKERGMKDAIAAKDGEIAALRDQLGKAKITDAQLDERIAERTAVLDAAKPYLPQGFDAKGKTLADVRRAAVAAQMGDAAKALNDAAIEGAFSAYTAATTKPSGTRVLADAMGGALRGSGHTNQTPLNDSDKAYEEMVARNAAAHKQRIGHQAAN